MTIPALWAHQTTGVDLAWKLYKELGLPHFAYFMEQGTGKTPTTIELMRRIFTEHQRPLRTLILCPYIVVKNWNREIGIFSACAPFVQVLTGPTKKRIKQYEEGVRQGKTIFITNIEALATGEGLLWKTKTRGKTEIRVPAQDWEMVIIDEAHRIKSPSSASFKMAVKLGDKAYFKYILTGTPIANNEMDIWALFRFLDGGATFGKSFNAFKTEWFVDKNAGMPEAIRFPKWVIKPGSSERISELIYKKAYRVVKDDCMSLPPLVKKQIACDMSPKQRKAYDDMKRDFIAYLESGAAVATLAITKALRLQQIASGFAKLEDESIVRFDDAPRLDVLAELLTDLPGKVIVWAVFKENYAAIAKVCEKLGRSYTFITGEQTPKEKDQAELDFTKGDKDILIANPGAGGTGVNLVEAPNAVWFSRGFKATDRWQAIARNHRGGSEQHEKITMYDIVADDCIDGHVLAALDNKESIAEGILGWKDRL